MNGAVQQRPVLYGFGHCGHGEIMISLPVRLTARIPVNDIDRRIEQLARYPLLLLLRKPAIQAKHGKRLGQRPEPCRLGQRLILHPRAVLPRLFPLLAEDIVQDKGRIPLSVEEQHLFRPSRPLLFPGHRMEDGGQPCATAVRAVLLFNGCFIPGRTAPYLRTEAAEMMMAIYSLKPGAIIRTEVIMNEAARH